MYPNLTLIIENQIPRLVFNPEEGMSRRLTLKEESIEEVLTELVKALNLIEEVEEAEEENIHYILNLGFEGDSRMIEAIPGMEKYKDEFGFSKFVNDHLDKAIEEKDDFSEYGEITEKVKKELERNQSIDILASLIDILINVIIAKTLLYSSDLGVGKIRLEDKDGFVRLQEKMSSELSKMDIELNII